MMVDDYTESWELVPLREWKAASKGMMMQFRDAKVHEVGAAIELVPPSTMFVNGAHNNEKMCAIYKYNKVACDVHMVYSYKHCSKDPGMVGFYIRATIGCDLVMRFDVISKISDKEWVGNIMRAMSGEMVCQMTFDPSVTVAKLHMMVTDKLCDMDCCTMQVNLKLTSTIGRSPQTKVRSVFSGDADRKPHAKKRHRE